LQGAESQGSVAEPTFHPQPDKILLVKAGGEVKCLYHQATGIVGFELLGQSPPKPTVTLVRK
jgi:hypothetical protein